MFILKGMLQNVIPRIINDKYLEVVDKLFVVYGRYINSLSRTHYQRNGSLYSIWVNSEGCSVNTGYFV